MIDKTIEKIYTMLLNKEFHEIETVTQGAHLNAAEIEKLISDYGRTLIPYPEGIKFDVIEITGSKNKSWSVVAPIYTLEESFSDLSLEMTLIKQDPGSLSLKKLVISPEIPTRILRFFT